MVSRVLYRPFEESDFDAVATILQRDWHTDSENDVYNYLEACADLCYCLSESTFSQIALIDDDVRGIVLARAGAPDTCWADRWKGAERDILAQMSAIEPDQTEAYLACTRTQATTNHHLLEQSGISRDDEICLLAVSSAAQGLGIGTILLDAATSYVSAQGATATYLYTDTDCTYTFYEHHNFKRMAQHRANREELRAGLPVRSFLYSLDLSA